MKKARLHIALIFLLGLIVCLCSVAFLKITDKIYQDTMTSLFTKILKVYSAPLGIILVGYFSTQKIKSQAPGSFYWVALIICTLWNLLFILRLLASCFSDTDSPQSILEYFENISLFSSFLIAACLSYYFFNVKKDEA